MQADVILRKPPPPSYAPEIGLKRNLDWHKKVQIRACFVVKIRYMHQVWGVGNKLSWTNKRKTTRI